MNASEFEKLLKSELAGPPSGFDNVEEGLFARIREANALGLLADLKRQEIPSEGFWDRVEEKLTRRITRYQEYDEPVDRCIGENVAESTVSWDSLESGLAQRIGAANRLEGWERQLKAEAILLPGQWENLEEKLEQRIEKTKRVPSIPEVTQFPWLMLSLMWLRRPTVLASLALTLLTLGGLGLYQARSLRPLVTLVYQVQGDASPLQVGEGGHSRVLPGNTVRSKPEESIMLVNQRGLVELQNGSHVKFQRADAGKIDYQVGFANGPHDSRGKVSFFVQKQKHREKFLVSTSDYQIEVTGTYFQVYPALDGRPTTLVLEGKVLIHSPSQEDLVVSEGQSLVYDIYSKRYRVLGGGPVVSRQEIDPVPSVEELQGYELLTITSNVPQIEVRIDGKFRGLTPLVLLQPLGPHSLHMGKEGFNTVDTLISVEKNAGNNLAALFAAVAVPTPKGIAEPTLARPETHSVKRHKASPVVASRDTTASPENVGEMVFRHAEEVQNQNWQLAFRLYQKALEYPISSFRKETALFSVARIRAEHESDKSQAKAEFLKYLALYPKGAFAGESWLRMAELEFAQNPDKSIEYYLKYFKQYPRHHRVSELEHRVGLIYLQQKEYDKAIAMLQESLSNVPYGTEDEKRPIYASLERAFLAKGDPENAALVEKQYLHADAKKAPKH